VRLTCIGGGNGPRVALRNVSGGSWDGKRGKIDKEEVNQMEGDIGGMNGKSRRDSLKDKTCSTLDLVYLSGIYVSNFSYMYLSCLQTYARQEFVLLTGRPSAVGRSLRHIHKTMQGRNVSTFSSINTTHEEKLVTFMS
jgi:hypothetical protein